jgi:serine/threonine-protein kinase RsbW
MLTNHQAAGFSESLTIANQFGELARVASWLEQMTQQHQLSENTVFKLDLVLNEALPNIISYAYPDQLHHEILIRFEDKADYILLEIIDDGLAFNPFAAVPLPEQLSLESSSINGRGIHLIKAFTDTQDYQRINNTNMMRVTIHKSPEPRKHLKASIA